MTGNKRRGFTLIELLIVTAIFSIAFLIATSVFVSVQKNQRGIAGRQRIVADGRYILEAMARSVRLGTIDYRYYADPDASCLVTNPASDCASDATWVANNPVSLTKPIDRLVVRDQNGLQTCYGINGTTLVSSSGGVNCETSSTNITPSDIVVTKFEVAISPFSDPFLGPRTSPADCAGSLPAADGTCPCNDGDDGQNNDIDTNACLPEQRCVTAGTGDICLNVNRQPTVTILLETRNANTSTGEQSSIALQTTVVSRIIKR